MQKVWDLNRLNSYDSRSLEYLVFVFSREHNIPLYWEKDVTTHSKIYYLHPDKRMRTNKPIFAIYYGFNAEHATLKVFKDDKFIELDVFRKVRNLIEDELEKILYSNPTSDLEK